MDEAAIRDLLSGEKRGPAASAARGGLWLASGPYGAAMRVRRWAYRRGLLARHAAGVPVICAGNLTTGGTGKTPLAAWLLERLRRRGRFPAVLSRGYRGDESGSDEARLLESLSGAKVYIGADRVASARRAVEDGADALVMDDGFQHLRLRRELDVVCIDATCPFGYGHVLPRGLLREGPRALRDAGAVVLTRSDAVSSDRRRQLLEILARLAPAAAIAAARHAPATLIGPAPGASAPPGLLAGRRVFAFCGLGNPEAFFATLRELGAVLLAERALGDHARYDAEQRRRLVEAFRTSGAELACTTAKDRVKLEGLQEQIPLHHLEIRLSIETGEADLEARIDRALDFGAVDRPGGPVESSPCRP